jgi:methyl-accepting chemotaxis protein
MQSIVTTMSEVNQHTQEIAGAVQQQSAATSEISHSVRQAARGTEDAVAHMPGGDQGGRRDQPVGRRHAAGKPRSSQQADQLRNTVETFLSEVSSTEKAMKEAS